MSHQKLNRPKPVVLIILDGWGIAPPSKANAISLAKTPAINNLIKTYPAMTLFASGEEAGLSKGEAVSSEAGHLNLGAGRLVYQDLPRINQAIKDGSFFTNQKFLEAIEKVKKNHSALQLMGLVSSGGVHSSISHLYALLKLCAQQKLTKVFIHVFLDGRDTPYNSGLDFIKKLEQQIKAEGVSKIASISGRFYALDRDNYWERTQLVYQAITNGSAKNKFNNPLQAIKSSYDQKVYDEEFLPTVIVDRNNRPLATLKDKDAVIFFNFRADRVRQLTKVFVARHFDQFPRPFLRNLFFVSLTNYGNDLKTAVAFAPQTIINPLAKVIADSGLKQLHLAETEKYAQITFFFNGGNQNQWSNEDWLMVPSPSAPYQTKPEMAAKKITKKVIAAIMAETYDFIVLNFANTDSVAHSGNLKATLNACEVVDNSVKQIIELILGKGGVAIITADHGNAEELINLQSGKEDIEHSAAPVPFILVGREWEGKTAGLPEVPNSDLSLLKPSGTLADVAPTVLKIMGLKKPREMTGKALI